MKGLQRCIALLAGFSSRAIDSYWLLCAMVVGWSLQSIVFFFLFRAFLVVSLQVALS